MKSVRDLITFMIIQISGKQVSSKYSNILVGINTAAYSKYFIQYILYVNYFNNWING